jgi:hypothetical protein
MEELFTANVHTENKMKRIFMFFVALLIILIALPVFGKVPYKLKNGHVIDAKKLMYNFEYMEREHESENEYELYAAGQKIGFVRIGEAFYFNPDFSQVYDLSSDGTFRAEPSAYFFEIDCTGDNIYTYFQEKESFLNLPRTLGGVIIFEDSLYYFAPGEINVYRITPLSKYFAVDKTCQNLSSPAEGLYYKLKPNNPTITGIPSYPLPLPLEVPDAPQLIIHE